MLFCPAGRLAVTDQGGHRCSHFSSSMQTMNAQWADEAARFQDILERELKGEVKAVEVLTKTEYRAAMERILCAHLPQGF